MMHFFNKVNLLSFRKIHESGFNKCLREGERVPEHVVYFRDLAKQYCICSYLFIGQIFNNYSQKHRKFIYSCSNAWGTVFNCTLILLLAVSTCNDFFSSFPSKSTTLWYWVCKYFKLCLLYSATPPKAASIHICIIKSFFLAQVYLQQRTNEQWKYVLEAVVHSVWKPVWEICSVFWETRKPKVSFPT